jgi:hypothetical protein
MLSFKIVGCMESSDKLTTYPTMLQMIYIRGSVCLTLYANAVDKWCGAFGQGSVTGDVNYDAAWFLYIYFDL